MAASALSALLGFGREITTAHFYGTHADVDAFLNASTIPVVLFGIFNGSIVAALVPTFSEYISRGRDDEARKLGSTVINSVLILMTALVMLAWFLAPFAVGIVAHGFPAAEQSLEVRMVRWLMPGILATFVSGVFAALLNVHHRFFGSALVPAAANITTIGFVLVLHRELGIFSLVLGSVVGLFAQLLVQVPSIVRYRLYSFDMDLRHPGLAKAWALLVPVAVGSGAWQINLAFDRYFASTLRAGSTAALGYTTKLVFLPILVVAGAISTVIFPLIAQQFASANRVGMRRSVSMALRMVSFIVIPCAAGLCALAFPIVRTLFERGAFGQAATAMCTSLIPFACVPLIAISYNAVMARACYACKAVRAAVTGSFLVIVINIGLSATLLPILGAKGLLLANGVATFCGTAYLVGVVSRVIGGFEWRSLLAAVVRIAVASLVMAGALYGTRLLGVMPPVSLASRSSYLLALFALAGVVYFGMCRALQVAELTLIIKRVQQRVARGSAPT